MRRFLAESADPRLPLTSYDGKCSADHTRKRRAPILRPPGWVRFFSGASAFLRACQTSRSSTQSVMFMPTPSGHTDACSSPLAIRTPARAECRLAAGIRKERTRCASMQGSCPPVWHADKWKRCSESCGQVSGGAATATAPFPPRPPSAGRASRVQGQVLRRPEPRRQSRRSRQARGGMRPPRPHARSPPNPQERRNLNGIRGDPP
jgi:hypothetical protein